MRLYIFAILALFMSCTTQEEKKNCLSDVHKINGYLVDLEELIIPAPQMIDRVLELVGEDSFIRKNEDYAVKIGDIDLYVDKWEMVFYRKEEQKLLLCFSFYPNQLSENACFLEYDLKNKELSHVFFSGKLKGLVVNNYSEFSLYNLTSELITKENVKFINTYSMFSGELKHLDVNMGSL